MKKRISLCLGIMVLAFLLIVNVSFVSATAQLICLEDGQTIFFSDCNANMNDYVCESTTCQVCTDEIRSGVYCPGSPNVCNGIPGGCTYITDEPIDPEQPPEDLPLITIVGPEDGLSEDSPTAIPFSFTVELSSRFETCELMVDDVSVDVKNRPIYLSTQIFPHTPEVGEHDWKIKCILRDSYGGWAVSSETRTITIGGEVTPAVCGDGVVEGTEQCDDGNVVDGDGCSAICEDEIPEEQTEVVLTSPANAYSVTGAQDINFNFGFDDTVVLDEIVSCELILNDVNVSQITEILSENTITHNLGIDSYTWSIDCILTDDSALSSISRTLTINEVPVSPPSGGGGGGGGSSGAKIYTFTQEQVNGGVVKSLKEKEKFKLLIVNETHHVTVDELTNVSVKVTVESDPQTLTLNIGNEKKVDVNGDNVYDISIFLKDIVEGKAEIIIRGIEEAVGTIGLDSDEEVSSEEIDATNAAGITGAVIGGIKNNKIPFAIAFVIIIGIAGAFSYNYKKKKS